MSYHNRPKIVKLRAEIRQIMKSKQEVLKDRRGSWRDMKIRIVNVKLLMLDRELERELFGRRIGNNCLTCHHDVPTKACKMWKWV